MLQKRSLYSLADDFFMTYLNDIPFRIFLIKNEINIKENYFPYREQTISISTKYIVTVQRKSIYLLSSKRFSITFLNCIQKVFY